MAEGLKNRALNKFFGHCKLYFEFPLSYPNSC